MEVKVIEERESPFFKRKDLKLVVTHHGASTPSKTEVAKELANKYNVDELQIQIKYLFSKRGSSESFGSAKVLKEKPKTEVKQETKSEANETQTDTAA